MAKTSIKNIALLTFAASTVAGCANLSDDQTSTLGLAGGYVAAKELGASEEVAILVGVAGSVFGRNAGNPCNTRQNGRVVETTATVNGRQYTGRSQTQATQYNCDTIGAPSGANPPVFSLIESNQPVIILNKDQFSHMVQNQSDLLTALAKQANVSPEEFVDAISQKIAIVEDVKSFEKRHVPN